MQRMIKNFKKRRWLSEENSRDGSINLSARKVVLNKQKSNSRNNSIESVHTFYLKQSPSIKQLKKWNSNLSLKSTKLREEIKEHDFDEECSESGNRVIYVEERVKMLKNSQYTHIYKSLRELCRQIKDFKTICQLGNENRQKLFGDKSNLKKSLWISFNDEEEINQIEKTNNFKINTRSVLGVKNNNDWIFGLNIGNIMHLSPLLFGEIDAEIKAEYSEDKLDREITNNSILEKITYLVSAYFWIATEFRFMNKKKSEKEYPK